MKRITGLILVVVMLVLSLVSCGYSFTKDDMTAYATFSGKTAFEEALKKLVIEDGDFTTDPATREKKVLDNIYSALANAVEDAEALTEGIPGIRDVVYYCYYATADFDGVTAIFYASNMKSSSPSSVQLGSDFDSDDAVSKAIAASLGVLDFKDKIYASNTSGKTTAGDIAFVTYTYSYTETTGEGDEAVTKEVTGTHTNDIVVIGAAAAEGEEATNFASYLCGASIASSIDKKTFTEDGKGEVTYSNIKINWVADGDEAVSFKDVTFTDSKSLTDTTGTSRELKNKELTYHIYPVYYNAVPEFTALNLVDVLFGEDITADIIYQIIFGEDYANLDKDDDEDKQKIEERAEWLVNYKTADGSSIEAVVTELVKLYEEIEETEEAKENAEEDYTDVISKYDDAKAALEKAQQEETPDADKIAELQEALNKATENKDKAEENREKAQKNYDDKVAEKDALIASFLAITVDGETMDAKLVKGYKIVTFDYLQESYNEEIRMNLAKEIYYFLAKNIEVTGTPEEAVELTYDRLMENYEYKFYKEDYNSSASISNYKQYKGSFKNYLIAAVSSDIKTVSTYAEAKAAVKAKAVEYVEPIVAIYLAANEYGQLVTDKEFKEYKKDPDNSYSYYEYYYGENSVLHAYQFDKLMNYFLEFEEDKSEADDNGYVTVTYKYKNTLLGAYEFGDPASEADTDAEAE